MTLPVTKASEISTESHKPRWLIQDLWLDGGVGFIGGEPKTCKTFMTLEMAVAVSSGKPCLRHYEVKKTGSVLVFSAEDSLEIVKRRLSAICKISGVELSACDINLITSPVLRIDLPEYRDSLTKTIEQYKPVLLVLDPFIRLHRIDENLSSEVSPILAYLRALQRTFNLSITIVHHARKRCGNSRAGQSLRGSSEFHAWYDSHLYLSRLGQDMLRMDVEHRSEPSKENIPIKIGVVDESVYLEPTEIPSEEEVPESLPLSDQIVSFLEGHNTAQSLNSIREFCKARKVTVSQELSKLISLGVIKRIDFGYVLAG